MSRLVTALESRTEPRFHFSEDFKEAEIISKGNPLVFCCICLPCVPAWLTLPSWITRNTMVQAETSVNGDEWNRYRSGPQGLRDRLEIIESMGNMIRHNKYKE